MRKEIYFRLQYVVKSVSGKNVPIIHSVFMAKNLTVTGVALIWSAPLQDRFTRFYINKLNFHIVSPAFPARRNGSVYIIAPLGVSSLENVVTCEKHRVIGDYIKNLIHITLMVCPYCFCYSRRPSGLIPRFSRVFILKN